MDIQPSHFILEHFTANRDNSLCTQVISSELAGICATYNVHEQNMTISEIQAKWNEHCTWTRNIIQIFRANDWRVVRLVIIKWWSMLYGTETVTWSIFKKCWRCHYSANLLLSSLPYHGYKSVSESQTDMMFCYVPYVTYFTYWKLTFVTLMHRINPDITIKLGGNSINEGIPTRMGKKEKEVDFSQLFSLFVLTDHIIENDAFVELK